MKEVVLFMPRMGESVMEAVVLKHLVKEGIHVSEGDPILEVATDKVNAEIPVDCSGVIKKLLVVEGDVVMIGSPIAVITTNHEDITTYPHDYNKEGNNITIVSSPLVNNHALLASPTTSQCTIKNNVSSTNIFCTVRYSPLVRNIAQQAGIALEELRKVPGTAKDHRITKKDLLAYLKDYVLPKKSHDTTSLFLQTKLAISQGDKVIPLDRVRKLIAERMVMSKRTSPHVTSFVRANVSNLVNWRNKNKEIFQQKNAIKLNYTPIFVEAVIKSLKAFPLLNALMIEDSIILKKDINIGLAVALPNGGLIVPVIKNANKLTFIELAKQIEMLVSKARNRQLVADELTDATYTISNIGTFHNLMGTPIIMQPQVAILALGAITKQPAVMSTEEGDHIVVQHEMFLSHTYDHRIIDGFLGGQFVKGVANHLESLDPYREIIYSI